MDSQAVEQDISVEAEATILDERAAEVFAWRLGQLERAGSSKEYALPLAGDHRVELHLACDLLRRVCPERTA